ncbi:phosphotransferase family protein [Cryptosporangium aurantiacum]|uniref:Phosphotransferase enzyme family protein n=1 Tax=Cryptosporangium aurantiacum TaxID=134849 RepID=A0A1M7RK47_9ACTN|nr:phosphotransferase [Cryptosporangium aurantiacum]SHN46531.1 Phosphotransferase enzyme family protein [Cryptosporangium aurantiacum]
MTAPLPLPTEDDPTLVIDDPADLTPAWLSRVLRLGSDIDADLRAVRAQRIGTGQIGASYRVELDGAPGAPPSVVVKIASGSDRSMVSQGFAWEVGFYRQLADRVRARIPRCWYGAISPDHTRFTLVLEDLSPAEPGSQAVGCAPDRARDAVVNLAGLHAPFWNSTFLAGGLEWLSPPDAEGCAFLGALHRDATDAFVKRFGTDLPAADAETLRAAADRTERWLAGHRAPFSLVHGDYRLDNLMFHPDRPEVAALDWQTISVGHPGRDLAYFLANSLSIDDRRAHEDDLVAGYHAELVRQGVSGYSLEDCRAGYRAGMLHGPLITVLGCVYATAQRSATADAMFLSMTAKTCQAIRDLGTLDSV